MIDWNGNGRIDSSDIGLNLAMKDGKRNSYKPNKGKPQPSGCLTTVVLALAVSAVIVCAIIFIGG